MEHEEKMTPKRDSLEEKISLYYMTGKEQDAMDRALMRSVKIITVKPKLDSLNRPYYTEAIHPRKKFGRVLKKVDRKLPANCKTWPNCACIFRGNARRDCGHES